MYKILWIAPNSLHDLSSASALQARSLIAFFTKLGIEVTVVTMPIFSKFNKECIDPILFSATQEDNNSFIDDGVRYIYSHATTSLDKLPVKEQRSFLNLFSTSLRHIKPDAVFCTDGDILTSTLLLEAHSCKIPTVFVLHKPIYADFDFALVDLILSTDSSLSNHFVTPRGRNAVEIGPWCFDPLPSQSQKQDELSIPYTEQVKTGKNASSSSLSKQHGPLLQALLELNQRTLDQGLSANDYQAELTKLEDMFRLKYLNTTKDSKANRAELESTKEENSQECDDHEGFTHEVLIAHVEVQYALNQVLGLVLNAPTQDGLRTVRFVFNERHAEQLKSHYNQVISYTLKTLKSTPELLVLTPNLEQLCSLSYEEFVKLPYVKITQGTDQFIEHLQRADLYLDLSLVSEPIDFAASLALSYGVPVLTTAQKQLPCELNVGLGIHTLAPNCCEMPLLVQPHQDLSPLIELVKAFLQTDKLKHQGNCFKALQECCSLEQALRCYHAVLPYLKRKASLNPHLMLGSMLDMRKAENK